MEIERRAWSSFEVKAVDDDARVIEGIATTAQLDRQGDIVEPEGATYSLPLPLLWMHRSDSPVGEVVAAAVDSKRIKVRAEIKKTDEPGELKNLLDKAWQALKLGLVKGLSIGFKPLERADIAGTFGERFTKWEWLELSLVTIPANADASITRIKSVSLEALAALGRTTSPGVAGTPVQINPKHMERKPVKTVTEQIADLEATRAAKAARLSEIQSKAAEAGRTKDEKEQDEFDTLRREVESCDKELVDLRALEKLQAASAKPVGQQLTTDDATKSRGTLVVVEREEKLLPGIAFARYAMCLAAAKGNMQQALGLAQTHYPKVKPLHDVLSMQVRTGQGIEKALEHHMLLQKAAVPAATTADSAWAGALVAYTTFAGDFVEFLRPRTILGQFGQGGRPDLRRIPFNVHIKGQTVGGTGYWVGEGKPKPVTRFGYNDTYHGWSKVAAIAVLTEEIMRFSDPSAERLVRDGLADVLIERLDTDFVDPAFGPAVANTTPASITFNVTPIPSSGATADDVRADIQALWAAASAANMPLTSAVYITTPAIALALSLMMNPLGQREFGGVEMGGGTLGGVPVIVSNYVPTGLFILAFASEIYFSDDGAATIDVSREASIQMLDNPTNDSTGATVPTQLVSMFQTDSVALRAHRFTNWSKRRNQAVSYLEDVAWGGAPLGS